MHLRWRGLDLPANVQIDTKSRSQTFTRFIAEPFEPGFGTTIGNSLRRVLLSSIEGAAITKVKIKGVTHEFSTIPGVLEDVVDIILNIKGVIVAMEGDGPKTMRLSAEGPGDVTAELIECDASIQIINPDKVIATLTDKIDFDIEFTVEKGRGYLPASGQIANEASKGTDQVIGEIPIDAIFSPVRRCTFTVEPTRVEQSTNYDKIVLDIETDGTMEPREALASAGATLRSLVDLVATMSDEPVALELGEVIGSGSGSPDLDLSIEDLDLSERPRNCLKRAQINTVGELLLRSEEDLLNITNFGQKSLDEIKLKLDERGLSLRI